MPRTSITSRAFTLVEVLVVVVILGLVSAVIIPQMGSRADLVAAAAARSLMADLTFAQNLAITNQRPVYVVFTNAAGNAPAPGGGYTVANVISPSVVPLTHPVTKSPWTFTFGTQVSGFPTVRMDSAAFDNQLVLMFDETGAPFDTTLGSALAPTALSTGSVRVVCNGYTLTVGIEPLTGTLTVR